MAPIPMLIDLTTPIEQKPPKNWVCGKSYNYRIKSFKKRMTQITWLNLLATHVIEWSIKNVRGVTDVLLLHLMTLLERFNLSGDVISLAFYIICILTINPRTTVQLIIVLQHLGEVWFGFIPSMIKSLEQY